jgi:transcription-repair coupling factor (superfamily II helicase)
MVYRRIAAARTEEELGRIMDEVRDRYGPPPLAVLNLADYGRIRVLADALRVESLEREGSLVVFRFREKARVDPVRLVSLVRERGDLQLVPPVSLKMDLKKPMVAQPPSGSAAALKQAHQSHTGRRRPKAEPAWWTARATAGEVTPGFSKAEILKPQAEDPRAPGGVLERVSDLLEELREA